MDTTTFIALYERAKRKHPADVAEIPYPNPLLKYHTFFSTLEGLRQDWREVGKDKDPGKHRPHRFWVRDLRRSGDRVVTCERFWPREVVDDLREAERGIPDAGGADPVTVPLGSLSDALVGACPTCASPGPLIGTYMQTRNSIEFDEWQFSLAVLCASCNAARPIHRQSECRRFAHEIFARI
ncbi:MAG: hypothetical protein RL272_183 [Candidatus Parcubacteria bacterium]|jgi:hypothetical protein